MSQGGAIALGILPFFLVIQPTQAEVFSPDFMRLKQRLEQVGFTVRLERPPSKGSYGTFQIKTRSIWINPVVSELGIAEPTLVHEAVHAVQYCTTVKVKPGAEKLKPFGLDLDTPTFLRPYFMRYSGDRRHVEREAYTVQIRGDRIDYAMQLLQKHCSPKR